MSKNTGSSQFRKVDVDAFDENNFQDDATETEGSSGPNESEVSNLLTQKKNAEALKAVLKNPPLNTSDLKAKKKAFDLVMRVLTAFRSSEIEGAVKGLNNDELDLLMKYIYRGFAEPTDSYCGILLSWHEKVYAMGGLGSIIRVLTSRKSV